MNFAKNLKKNIALFKKMEPLTCLDCKIKWDTYCMVCKKKRKNPWEYLKQSLSKDAKDKFEPEIPVRKNGSPYTKRVTKLLRKGHDAKCKCCESESGLTFDHIIPLSKGGADSNANGQILCRRCNGIKGSKIISIYELRKTINTKT